MFAMRLVCGVIKKAQRSVLITEVGFTNQISQVYWFVHFLKKYCDIGYLLNITVLFDG